MAAGRSKYDEDTYFLECDYCGARVDGETTSHAYQMTCLENEAIEEGWIHRGGDRWDCRTCAIWRPFILNLNLGDSIADWATVRIVAGIAQDPIESFSAVEVFLAHCPERIPANFERIASILQRLEADDDQWSRVLIGRVIKGRHDSLVTWAKAALLEERPQTERERSLDAMEAMFRFDRRSWTELVVCALSDWDGAGVGGKRLLKKLVDENGIGDVTQIAPDLVSRHRALILTSSASRFRLQWQTDELTFLRDGLSSGDEVTCCEAVRQVEALGPDGGQFGLWPALETLSRHASPEVRRVSRAALDALRTATERRVAGCRKMCKTSETSLRILAADSLRAVGPAAIAAVPELVTLLSDDDLMVRLRAVYALKRIGCATQNVLAEISRLIKHPHRILREESQAALTHLRAASHS